LLLSAVHQKVVEAALASAFHECGQQGERGL
jgi:hypothetical protein